MKREKEKRCRCFQLFPQHMLGAQLPILTAGCPSTVANVEMIAVVPTDHLQHRNGSMSPSSTRSRLPVGVLLASNCPVSPTCGCRCSHHRGPAPVPPPTETPGRSTPEARREAKTASEMLLQDYPTYMQSINYP